MISGQSDFQFTDWSEAFDSLDTGVSVLSSDLRLEYINDSYRKIVNIPDEIQAGCAAYDLYLLFARRGDFGEGKPEKLANDRLVSIDNGTWEDAVHQQADGRINKIQRTRLRGGYILTSVTDITKIKQHEMLLSSVLDSTDQAVVISDKHGKVELINAAFVRLVGFEGDFVAGSLTYHDLMQDAWRAGVFAGEFFGRDVNEYSEDEFQSGLVKFCEMILNESQTITMADGKYLKFSSRYIENSRRIFTFTDITDSTLRQIEIDQARKTSENSLTDFSAALDNMDVGVLLVDRDLNALIINEKFYQIWNMDPMSFSIGSGIQSLMEVNRNNNIYTVKNEDWDDEVWENYIKTRMSEVRSGTIEPQEFPCSDGRVITFSCSALSDGHRLLTYSDITEFKTRERELKQAKLDSERTLGDFSAALNNMDLGLVLLDNDLNTLIVNQAFHDIWHTDADAFPKGTPFRALMDYNRHNGIMDVKDVDWEEHIQSRLAELRAGDVAPRELARADGAFQIYACTTLASGFKLVSYTDVTDFKRREAQLEYAQMQAESADRSKSEFLANMSHEIRTPMNGVMGMAELLGKTELSAKQKMFTDVILSSSTALLTIINDILDFSKIEAGKLELDPAPFQISRAIEDVATLVSTNVAEKGLELIVRIQPDLGDYVVGDIGRFRQIITNLLGNAVKFTEMGHVLVDVSGAVENGIATLKCSVQDTGIGIPESQLETVFEKFSQVDGSSTRRHEGTGLGLAITSRLVELMNGEIGCNSVLGEGSTFWFTAKMPVDENARPAHPTPVDITGARLLAIDDNSVNCSILLEQFDAWKLNGTAAASGLEGLAMLRQSIREEKPFDAIVLDFHMPDMNGLEVARVIRSDEQLKDTIIIMLTSVDNISDSQEFKQLDINAHLTKPARASQLLESIVDVLRPAEGLSPLQAEIHLGSGNESKENQTGVSTAPFLPTATEIALADVEDISVAAVMRNDVREIVAQAEELLASSLCILVAEDNEVNQMVFTQILEHMECNFKIVENGQLAVEEVIASRPEIVLMDVSMPVMNGLDATREIRNQFGDDNGDDSYRPIIIGVTAHALKDDRKMCISAGMDDYLSKPISPDMLIAKIEQWLSVGTEKEGQLKAG